jgi:hypothetical protein
VGGKVDDTLVGLSVAIQNVGVVKDFSNLHLTEVRIAAMFLLAGVLDCLTSLIDWIKKSRMFLFTGGESHLMLGLGKTLEKSPEFDQKLRDVQARSQLYAIALQTKMDLERQLNDILQWLSPVNYLTPKSGKEYEETCHWFFESAKYTDWVDQGPSTLICSGKGIAFHGTSLMLAGAGKSHLVFDTRFEVS